MMKILLLCFYIVMSYASEKDTNNKIGYTFANPVLNVREQPTVKSTKIDELEYEHEVEILKVEYDEDGNYWYKTSYGYVFGRSVATDVRYSKVDFLHIRWKPSLKGKVASYYLTNDKVIVIRPAGKSDGYNWVLTTDGYVASDYLTESLVSSIKVVKQNIKKIAVLKVKDIKVIKFREKPSIKSKIVKEIKKEKIKLVVPKAKVIPKGKTIEELEKEYKYKQMLKEQKIKEEQERLAKIKAQKEKEIELEKIRVAKEKAEQEELERQRIENLKPKWIQLEGTNPKTVYSNMKLADFTASFLVANNLYEQSNQIGTKLDNIGMGYSLKLRLKNIHFPRQRFATVEFENVQYSQREKYNLLFGVDKFLKQNKQFSPYIGASTGISIIKWTKDPLSNSYASYPQAYSWIVKFNAGSKYNLDKRIILDFNINHSFYSHRTVIVSGAQRSVIEDKQTLKASVGINYTF